MNMMKCSICSKEIQDINDCKYRIIIDDRVNVTEDYLDICNDICLLNWHKSIVKMIEKLEAIVNG